MPHPEGTERLKGAGEGGGSRQVGDLMEGRTDGCPPYEGPSNQLRSRVKGGGGQRKKTKIGGTGRQAGDGTGGG